MTPLAGILCLKGWQPYIRRTKVDKMIEFRFMLMKDDGTTVLFMVTAYAEVLEKKHDATIQLISRGEVLKQCDLLPWERVAPELLELLAKPIMEGHGVIR